MTQERKRRPSQGGADLRRDRQNAYTKQDETATAVSPRFVIELVRVEAYRVRIEPRNAMQPYVSSDMWLFPTHAEAFYHAEDTAKSWGFSVVDLSRGEANG